VNWMAWTVPTAVFFVGIALALCVMTWLELKRPSKTMRGFLPMPTTRGDRFFIALLSAAFIHLFWLWAAGGYMGVATVAAMLWAGVLMRWG